MRDLEIYLLAFAQRKLLKKSSHIISYREIFLKKYTFISQHFARFEKINRQENYMQPIQCHDCGKTLVKNDEYMDYEVESGSFSKCRTCHEINPVLQNFRETEVYSRVVGYIRPVSQWNKGKQAEYNDRKEFTPATCEY